MIASFAASGPLLAQIERGVPADVFASADEDGPRRGQRAPCGGHAPNLSYQPPCARGAGAAHDAKPGGGAGRSGTRSVRYPLCSRLPTMGRSCVNGARSWRNAFSPQPFRQLLSERSDCKAPLPISTPGWTRRGRSTSATWPLPPMFASPTSRETAPQPARHPLRPPPKPRGLRRCRLWPNVCDNWSRRSRQRGGKLRSGITGQHRPSRPCPTWR